MSGIRPAYRTRALNQRAYTRYGRIYGQVFPVRVRYSRVGKREQPCRNTARTYRILGQGGSAGLLGLRAPGCPRLLAWGQIPRPFVPGTGVVPAWHRRPAISWIGKRRIPRGQCYLERPAAEDLLDSVADAFDVDASAVPAGRHRQAIRAWACLLRRASNLNLRDAALRAFHRAGYRESRGKWMPWPRSHHGDVDGEVQGMGLTPRSRS